MSHHLISFDNGTVGYLYGGLSIEEKAVQMLARCKAVGMGANLVEAGTYKVVGRVRLHAGTFAYEPVKEGA